MARGAVQCKHASYMEAEIQRLKTGPQTKFLCKVLHQFEQCALNGGRFSHKYLELTQYEQKARAAKQYRQKLRTSQIYGDSVMN